MLYGVCVCARVHACVHMCVSERERKREREDTNCTICLTKYTVWH